jgi:hypothetical protein
MAIEETEELVAISMVSGKCSRGLVLELDDHIQQRTLHVHMILDEIAALEGVAGAKPSITKPATRFLHEPLQGLWHKHFMQPAYIAMNLSNHWTCERFQKLREETSIETLVHHLGVDGYTERAASAALTGEWIVFARQDNVNYYLTLGHHGDDEKIWRRCQACAREFGEIDILREERL